MKTATVLYHAGTVLWTIAIIPYVVVFWLILDGTKRAEHGDQEADA